MLGPAGCPLRWGPQRFPGEGLQLRDRASPPLIASFPFRMLYINFPLLFFYLVRYYLFSNAYSDPCCVLTALHASLHLFLPAVLKCGYLSYRRGNGFQKGSQVLDLSMDTQLVHWHEPRSGLLKGLHIYIDGKSRHFIFFNLNTFRLACSLSKSPWCFKPGVMLVCL